MKFYFTYGLADNHPFKGGWTKVEAEDINEAINIFNAFHERDKDGFINCAGIYDEDRFRTTNMFENGNFGAFCHERISVTREILTKE